MHPVTSMFYSHTKVVASRLMFIVLSAVVIVPAECTWAKTLALIGGTIFTAPEDTPIEQGVVVLRDDKIISVGSLNTVDAPSSAETIDAAGLYK